MRLRPIVRELKGRLLGAMLIGLSAGAAAAGVAAMRATWWQSLPFGEADRLVAIREMRGPDPVASTPQEVATLDRVLVMVGGVGAYAKTPPALVVSQGRRQVVETGMLSAGLLQALQITPVMGREFNAADVPKQNALISASFWRRRWGSSEAVIGDVISVEGLDHTIIGVTPDSLGVLIAADVLVAVPSSPAGSGPRVLELVGRLADGASPDAVKAELRPWLAQMATEQRESQGITGAEVVPLHDALVGDLRSRTAAVAALGMLLLVGSATTAAALQVIRATRRRREWAILVALGAAPRDLLLKQLREVGAQLAVAVPLGVVSGLWFTQLADAALPNRWLSYTLGQHDLIALGSAAAAAAVSIATAVAVLPTIRPGAIAPVLRIGFFAGESRHRANVDLWLLLGQAAFAAAFGYVALGMATSAMTSWPNPSGIVVDRLWAVRLKTLSGDRMPKGRQSQLWLSMRNALSQVNGVSAVGGVSQLPILGLPTRIPLSVRDSPLPGAEHTVFRLVTPGYFESIGAGLIEGRFYTDDDTPDAGRVLVVNQAFVKHYLQDRVAIGREVQLASGPWFRVIGVVADTFDSGSEQPSIVPEVYLSTTQAASSGEMWMTVRTHRANLDQQQLLSTIHSVDSGVAVGQIGPVADMLAAPSQPERTAGLLVASVAVVAISLSLAGAYAVALASALRRRRDAAIRLVLGADRRQLVGIVAVRTAVAYTAGAIVGVLVVRAAAQLTTMNPVVNADARLLTSVLATMVLGGLALAATAAALGLRGTVAQIVRSE